MNLTNDMDLTSAGSDYDDIIWDDIAWTEGQLYNALHLIVTPNNELAEPSDPSYHRQLAKPLTRRKITKKERKANGPNAQTQRGMKCKDVIQFSDGSVYRGTDPRYMYVGGSYVKMNTGVPYVRVGTNGISN